MKTYQVEIKETLCMTAHTFWFSSIINNKYVTFFQWFDIKEVIDGPKIINNFYLT